MDVQSNITTLSPMRIDQNGDGIVDTRVTPNIGGVAFLDLIPPEATIGFSTTTKRIITTGTDNLSTPTVTTSTTSTIITDASGNALTLKISKSTTQTNSATLIFPSFRYSNPSNTSGQAGSTTNATTSLRYFWSTDKAGKYTLFIAAIKTPTERIVSIYSALTNKTYVVAATPNDDTADLSAQSAQLLLRNKLKTFSGIVISHISHDLLEKLNQQGSEGCTPHQNFVLDKVITYSSLRFIHARGKLYN